MPVKQLKMVIGWLALHEEEAYAAWNKAVRGEAFDKIKPSMAVRALSAAVFASAAVDHGVVVWLDGEIDIAPETMYANSYVYNEMPM